MSNPSNSIEIGITPKNGDLAKPANLYDNEPVALRNRHRLIRELAISRRESPKI
jgi:hypothetical protein